MTLSVSFTLAANRFMQAVVNAEQRSSLTPGEHAILLAGAIGEIAGGLDPVVRRSLLEEIIELHRSQIPA